MAGESVPQGNISGLFKKRYANLSDILPDNGYWVMKEVAPFEAKYKNGSSVEVAVNLTHENGITLAGSTGAVVTFNDPASGAVKQATITPSELFLTSALSTAAISRAAAQGEQAFDQATKNRVKQNLKSHMKFCEHLCIYGQDSVGIGECDTSADDGGFTNGIDVDNKKFELSFASFSIGIFLGAEGMAVEQVKADDSVVDVGVITGVDLENRIITVSGTPEADTASFLQLKNQEEAIDMVGIKKILSTSGSLFGISNATYSLWKGSTYSVGGNLTFAKLMAALEKAAEKGLDGDVTVLVPHHAWRQLLSEQAALRDYDSSYSPTEVSNGSKAIKFYFTTGMVKIRPSRYVRNGDAFILADGDWKRYGSSDLTMKIPGIDDGDLIQKPVTTSAFYFRSYSDQQIFCHAPARSVYLSGITVSA